MVQEPPLLFPHPLPELVCELTHLYGGREMAATVVLDSVTENGVLTLAVNEVGHAPPGTVPV